MNRPGIIYMLGIGDRAYIGQTKYATIKERYPRGKVPPGQARLHRFVEKYAGGDVRKLNSAILEDGLSDPVVRNQREAYWIFIYETTDPERGLNLTTGGDFGELSEEARAKRKAACQKRAQDPVWLAKNKAACQKLAQDPVWLARNRAAAQKRAQDPEWLAKQKAANQKRSQDPEWRANVRAALTIANKKLAQDPVWRANMKAAGQKLAQDPVWLAKNKAAGQKRAQDPVWRAKHRAANQKRAQDPEWLAKHRAAHQKLAQDPEWRAKQKAAGQKRSILRDWFHPDHGEIRQKSASELARMFGLDQGSLCGVALGKFSQHKGWRKLSVTLDTNPEI